MAQQKRILVVGAGIAGQVLAYWLSKASFSVTVIERSPSFFKAGQGIDLEGAARRIIQLMDLEEVIKSRTTGEQGFAITDDDAKPVAIIDGGFTSDIEIMRGELVEILTQAVRKSRDVEFSYDRTITELEQKEREVRVTFNDGTNASFDIVVGADGLRSSTRDLLFDKTESRNALRPRDQYIAYFTVPSQQQDGKISRWQNATGGRSILVRPVSESISSAYVTVASPSERLASLVGGRDKAPAQKEAIAELFDDVTGEGERVIREMLSAEDFYFERIAQIKLDRWSNGRGVLVGDAAYAPSPITGEGTNLAVVGAYVLAGELAEAANETSSASSAVTTSTKPTEQGKSHPTFDPKPAFLKYEERLRPYIKKAQTIPLGGRAPKLANPDSTAGIWLLRSVFQVLAWTKVWKLVDPGQPDSFDLPEYKALHEKK